MKSKAEIAQAVSLYEVLNQRARRIDSNFFRKAILMMLVILKYKDQKKVLYFVSI
jgi:hypothetical protein